jgi:hypothetical protein
MNRSILKRFAPFTTVVIVAGIATGAQRARPLQLPDDPIEHLISSKAVEISNLRGKFTLHQGDTPPRQISLSWDRSGDRINASLARPIQNNEQPYLRSFVQNHGASWEARPEYDKEHEGSWDVAKTPVNAPPIPRDISRGELGITFLENEVLTPLMTAAAQRELPLIDDPEVKLDVKDVPGAANSTDRSYTLSTGGQVLAVVTYNLDLSDGVRINSARQATTVGQTLVTTYEQQFSHFKKFGDAWVPTDIVITKWDRQGKQTNVSTLKFDELEVNGTFKDEDFIYKPPYGSKVRDAFTGITYREGYNNPFARLGHDEPISVDAVAALGPATPAAVIATVAGGAHASIPSGKRSANAAATPIVPGVIALTTAQPPIPARLPYIALLAGAVAAAVAVAAAWWRGRKRIA